MNQSIVAAALAVLSLSAQGQQPGSDYVVEATYLSAAPTLDGRLDDPVWTETALMDDFTQLEPDEGAPATDRTEVRVGYDDRRLYLGVRCYFAEPEKIVATTVERDGDFFSDDSVQIVLDTFFDRKNAFLFAVNAVGAQYDALVRNEGDEVNYAWDGIWFATTSRDAQGWTAELAIPFRTLRFPKTAEQTWGLNVQRLTVHKREYVIWKPIPRYAVGQALYRISQAGQLTGLKNLKQGRRFDIRPHVVAKWEEQRPGSDDTSFEVGVDVKKNLTTDLVLDLTYNLDFAEAEADRQQINLTRFKLFFPEKRDFFLEGSDLFYVGERRDQLKPPDRIFFFSRRIGLTEDGQHTIPVLGGAKISGHVGRTGIGVLNLTTDDLRYTDRSGAEQYVPRTNFSVLRLKRGILEKSSLGLMWLNKDVAGGVDNSGAAADWDFAFGKNLRTGGFVAKTSSPGRDGADWAGGADVLWDSRRTSLRVTYTEIGEDFNPEMGFFPRIGIREWRARLVYDYRPRESKLRNLKSFVNFTHITDRDGNLETRITHLETDWVGNNYAALFVKLYDNVEVLDAPFEVSRGVIIPPGEYHFQNYFLGAQTNPTKPFFGYARLYGGEYYDGDYQTLYLGAIIRPMTGLLTRWTVEHTDVDLPAGEFEVDLATALVIYSLSPRITFRSLVQWRKDDNFDAQVLFQWLYRPGAAFYLVYDEYRDLNDLVAADERVRDRALMTKMTFFF